MAGWVFFRLSRLLVWIVWQSSQDTSFFLWMLESQAEMDGEFSWQFRQTRDLSSGRSCRVKVIKSFMAPPPARTWVDPGP
jgi:hypothetical protein